jgi:hypothetical protein
MIYLFINYYSSYLYVYHKKKNMNLYRISADGLASAMNFSVKQRDEDFHETYFFLQDRLKKLENATKLYGFFFVFAVLFIYFFNYYCYFIYLFIFFLVKVFIERCLTFVWWASWSLAVWEAISSVWRMTILFSRFSFLFFFFFINIKCISPIRFT